MIFLMNLFFIPFAVAQENCFNNPTDLKKFNQQEVPTVLKNFPSRIAGKNFLGIAAAIELSANNDAFRYKAQIKTGSAPTSSDGELIKICFDNEKKTFSLKAKNNEVIEGKITEKGVNVRGLDLKISTDQQFAAFKSTHFLNLEDTVEAKAKGSGGVVN